MKTNLKALIAGLVLSIGITSSAYGYQSTTSVWVNGARLTPEQLREAERLYGGPIANGRYWLDTKTGIWGYEGGPAQGRLGEGAQGSAYIRRGPGGYTGSDGSTSYYFNSDSGCSVIPGAGVSC